MKQPILSTRTVELLVSILGLALIAAGIGLYAFNEPTRIAAAQELQIAADLDEAMTLYAENCSVCHGLAGEGIGAAPALAGDALAAADPETLFKTIARGLPNTAMPAWNQADGGPLSDYQVGQLTLLVQQGDWQAVQDRVVNLGLAPRVPFTTRPDPAILESVQRLPDGELLARGVAIYAETCVACHGADGLGSPLAPALNDAAVRAQTAETIRRTILNGVAGTNMAAWGSSLAAEDVDALVKLIENWEQVPAGAIPAPDQPVAVTQESLAQGAALYSANCARCHAAEGQGTPRAPALNVRSFLSGANDAAIQQIVTQGVTGTAMPAWGDRLSAVEIQSIVGFIRSWEPTAPEVATPARGGGPWWRNNAAAGQNLPSGGASQNAPGGQPAASQAGGPPWAQAPQEPASDGQTLIRQMDTRSLALVGGLIASAVFLLVLGFLELRRVSAG